MFATKLSFQYLTTISFSHESEKSSVCVSENVSAKYHFLRNGQSGNILCVVFVALQCGPNTLSPFFTCAACIADMCDRSGFDSISPSRLSSRRLCFNYFLGICTVY